MCFQLCLLVTMAVSFDYSGKLVLVTGSTKGIGRTVAEHYVKSGASLIVNGRSHYDWQEHRTTTRSL